VPEQACRGNGRVTVLVTDQCKTCKPQEININALAFEQHISNVSGSVNVVWQQVGVPSLGSCGLWNTKMIHFTVA
jgi:hypothetical protein